MTKFDIGISGSSDRTRFIVQDGFGAQHTFITIDEIKSLVSTAALSAGGVYVLAPDVETLEELLGFASVLNIFYTGPSIGVDVIAATVTSDKRVYSYSADTIDLKAIGEASITLTFPTDSGDITEGTTAFVKFYTGATVTVNAISTIGGIDSDTTGVKITTLRGAGVLGFSVSADAPIVYEINERPTDYTLDDKVSFELWSGLNVTGKLQHDMVVISTDGENRTVIDGNGSTSYDNAPIPDNLLTTYRYEFSVLHTIQIEKTTGSKIEGFGTYRNNTGNYVAQTTGPINMTISDPTSGNITNYILAAPLIVGTAYAIGMFSVRPIVP
jgi:hypothetical protein